VPINVVPKVRVELTQGHPLPVFEFDEKLRRRGSFGREEALMP